MDISQGRNWPVLSHLRKHMRERGGEKNYIKGWEKETALLADLVNSWIAKTRKCKNLHKLGFWLGLLVNKEKALTRSIFSGSCFYSKRFTLHPFMLVLGKCSWFWVILNYFDWSRTIPVYRHVPGESDKLVARLNKKDFTKMVFLHIIRKKIKSLFPL